MAPSAKEPRSANVKVAQSRRVHTNGRSDMQERKSRDDSNPRQMRHYIGINQVASGEIQEMEHVQSLVELQAATIASEQPLSIEQVEQVRSALAREDTNAVVGGA
ncbi:hypothetical protein PF008_g12220 [Phytophthora fragariae]|uniref:Uncharacterized protein n=1 Tax=Phytophthora fragariae TaxID=53985 RepID=A0A6G0RPE7_9STRA|nr:hypothetical protein PF008_g12220 [Phytophthora fragariae]